MNWETVAKLSQDAFREGVNEWISKARVNGGSINGSAATLPPGTLSSETSIEGTMQRSLLAAQVPADVARAIAGQLGAAWNQWAAGFTIQLPSAYPAFAAFPGPVAPPTPAIPVPLSKGGSAGEIGLKAAVLGHKLETAVRVHSKKVSGSPEKALKALAAWIEGSFNEWKNIALLVGLMGKGPVPTFAPPYVPVGPVVHGDNFSAGPALAGPRFGKIVF